MLVGRLINDVLATKAHACVRAVDFGESFGPLVDVLDGRHLRFATGSDRTINVWDYAGLERGELPASLRQQLDNLIQMRGRDPQGRIPLDIEFSL